MRTAGKGKAAGKWQNRIATVESPKKGFWNDLVYHENEGLGGRAQVAGGRL